MERTCAEEHKSQQTSLKYWYVGSSSWDFVSAENPLGRLGSVKDHKWYEQADIPNYGVIEEALKHFSKPEQCSEMSALAFYEYIHEKFWNGLRMNGSIMRTMFTFLIATQLIGSYPMPVAVPCLQLFSSSFFGIELVVW